MKIEVHKFASTTYRLGLVNPIEITRSFHSLPGTAVVVQALTENPLYPEIELTDGSFATIKKGDVLAGVFGSRRALRGFVGYAPYRASAGDILHILNLGGVVGRAIGGHKDLGDPIQVRLLGAVTDGKKVVNLKDAALPSAFALVSPKPIVLIVGSCMNTGKTAAAIELVRQFRKRGYRVGAAKVSGVGCLKDTRRMLLAGATQALSFLDCGIPSTVDCDDLQTLARTLVQALSSDVDIIVMELGDGLLGYYHVDNVLADAEFMSHVAAVVFSAGDLVAVYGGKQLLKDKGISISVVCGPATDSCAGTDYIEGLLGVPAANALTEPEKLISIVMSDLHAKVVSPWVSR